MEINSAVAPRVTNTWSQPPADLKLAEGHVDIWRTRLDLPENDTADYLALLSDEEIARAERFMVSSKRREYIVTRGVLRKLLAQMLHADPGSLRFALTDRGKPYLMDQPLLQTVNFNVTHSHNLALIAVALNRAVGIDVEYIRPNVDFANVAKQVFSSREIASLGFYGGELPKAFFACWTRKEAFVKALGHGISLDLRAVSVSVDPHETTPSLLTYERDGETRKWLLLNIKTDDAYMAALAVDDDKLEVRCWDQPRQGAARPVFRPRMQSNSSGDNLTSEI